MKTNKITLFNLIFINFIVLFCSCNSKSDYYKIGLLKENIIAKGDITSYKKLLSEVDIDNNLTYDMPYYCTIMAINYNYKPAYYDAFSFFRASFSYDVSLKIKSKEIKDLTLFLFKNAIMNGDSLASAELFKYYMPQGCYPEEILFIDSLLINKAKKNLGNASINLSVKSRP